MGLQRQTTRRRPGPDGYDGAMSTFPVRSAGRRRPARRGALLAALLAALALPAAAIQTCELDGQHVNPNNGHTTAGKTGLMPCKDADTGVLQREQELRNGVFMGIVRFYKDGQLEREHTVNEKGNRDGVVREWNVEAGKPRVLVRESTERNGRTVGLSKSWYPTGERRRLTWYGDEDREQASVDFDREGRVTDLRCTRQPVFGRDFDDRAACGFAGPSTVTLIGAKGVPVTRLVFVEGERRKTESLYESGSVRELRETTDTGVVERRYAADGTKLREVRWARVSAGSGTDARSRTVKVLEQEYHASGKLVQEQRWVPDDKLGAVMASEARWYLNGQPKERSDYATVGAQRTRRDTTFHDNGKPAFEGTWVVGPSGSRFDRAQRPTGTHKGYDDTGRVRSERVFDDKGRLTREREFDERGSLVRDDEVYEDGSRKAVGR